MEHMQARHPSHDDTQGTFPAVNKQQQQQQQQQALLEAQQYHPLHYPPSGSPSAATAAHSQGTAAAVRQELQDAWSSQATASAHRHPPDLAAQVVSAWAQQAAMAETPQLTSQLVEVRQVKYDSCGGQRPARGFSVENEMCLADGQCHEPRNPCPAMSGGSPHPRRLL